ncbi:MAG: FKBP-type peptidyl-prolyl cis-trans isomerase [Rikenellaceae bacterium]
MKKFIILSAAVALVFSSCGTGSKSIKTTEDSLAYAIGLDLGNYVKNLDSTINVDLVASAMKDVLANKQSMDQEQAYNFLREYFTVRKPAEAKAKAAKLLTDAKAANPNIQTTASGLMYEVIEEGGKKPVKDDAKVRVSYEGKLLSTGKIFDSSYQRGDTVEFALNQVIPGWGEGLKLVGEGGKIKLWIPSDLAYGEQGAGQVIGANEALVFEVELFEVN